jgi:4-amino-4-deoxy-L-arabinose transferase-like glycosyltransferase
VPASAVPGEGSCVGRWRLLDPPAVDFTDPLKARTPAAPSSAARPALLLGLLLICLAPRALMAVKLDVLAPDAAYYIEIATHLEHGEFEAAFRGLHFNVYPIALMLLHRAGLEWELAGKLLSLTMSVLVVLPLFGLLRRQFNDQIATVACLLYAAHPTFIEWSPAAIRDPMFWFLLTFTLCYLWRAVTEVRLSLFLAAGLGLALAIHVRSEGWLLFIPLVLWLGWRWLALTRARSRLTAGAVLCIALIPSLLATVNLTLLRDSPHWELGRFKHLNMIRGWLPEPVRGSRVEGPASRVAATGQSAASKLATRAEQGVHCPAVGPACRAGLPDAPPANVVRTLRVRVPNKTTAGPEQRVHRSSQDPPRELPVPVLLPAPTAPAGSNALRPLLGIYFEKFLKAFSPVHGLLLLGGLWSGRRLLAHRHQQAGLWMIVALFAAVWVCLATHAEMNTRYFLPAVLLSIPYAAVGLLRLAQALIPFLQRGASRRRVLVVGLLATASLYGWGDALSSGSKSRRSDMDLGRWVFRDYGPGQLVLGTNTRLVAYYARGTYLELRKPLDSSRLKRILTKRSPRVAFLRPTDRQRLSGHLEAALLQEIGQLGYVPAEPADLPASCREFIVLLPVAPR